MAVQISGNDITVPRDGSFTRNVTIGGTLTYEDVTNIDSVGLVTARTGIEIGARPGVAASISVDGNMIVSGISTFGGDVQVPDKIIHSGDTNTAIRFPSADTITAETGGSERVRITSAGKLGLGVASPVAVAHIEGGSEGNLLQLSNTHTGATTNDGFVMGINSTMTYLYNRENKDVTFGTNNLEKLRITSDGDIFQGTSSSTARFAIQGSSSSTSATSSDTNGVSLILSNTDTTNNNWQGVEFSDRTDSADFITAMISQCTNHSSNYGDLTFWTNGSSGRGERLRINSNGHMGLGVTPNANWPANGDFRGFQIGTGACVFGRGSGDEDRGGIAVNYYHTGSAEKYLANGNASGILLNDGDIDFFTAGANSSGADAAMSKTLTMRIAPDGDIGVGILDPDGRVHIMGGNLGGAGSVTAASDAKLLVLESNDSNGLSLINANDERANIRFGTTGTDGNLEASISYAHEAVSTTADRRSMIFKVGGNSEKMRILSGGVCMGRTSLTSYTAALHIGATAGGGIAIATHADTTCMYFNRTDNNAAYVAMRFYTQGGQRGYIQVNTGSTTYSTSGSDIRLKKDIEDWTEEVLPYFKSLKPQKFRFNSEDETVEKTKGYMAQDNLDKFPEAYPLNSEDDRYWFAPQHMIPYLMKALQEEIVKREEIEAKYNALEARLDAAGL